MPCIPLLFDASLLGMLLTRTRLVSSSWTGSRLAKVNTDAVFDASSDTVVLYPENGGNLHCFTALTPCAVLDVMAPPIQPC
jgi:hypothetical protein